MIQSVFTSVLTMSLTVIPAIALVLLARQIIRQGPKRFSYLLWLVVFLRLLLPISIKAPVPELPATFDAQALVTQWADLAADIQETAVSSPVSVPAAEDSTTLWPLLSGLWLTGAAALVFYTALSTLRLRGRLRAAVHLRDNVFRADHLGAPFVLGILRPRIYVPSDLQERELDYILAHEQHHIRRFDHVIRLAAYAALCLHWFNPLVWVAFRLMVKDMEMSCDEAVLSTLGADIRSDYSQSLLDLAARQKSPVWTPLSFGQSSTAPRIRNVLKWKKPSVAATVLTTVLTVAAAIFAMTEVESAIAANEELSLQNSALLHHEEIPDTRSSVREQRYYFVCDPSRCTITRTADLVTDVLTEEQATYLLHCLNTLPPQLVSDADQEMNCIFSINLRGTGKDCLIRFGYACAEPVVTVNDLVINSETLTAYLYHIYCARGTISYAGQQLPEDAQLVSSEHCVQTYQYYCKTCGQYETASTSYMCDDCCKAYWYHESRRIVGRHH